MANLAAVLAVVEQIEADTSNIENAFRVAQEQNAALVQEIADLKAQIAEGTGVTAADLDHLASRLAAIDAALDAVAPDAPNEPNVPVEPGEEDEDEENPGPQE